MTESLLFTAPVHNGTVLCLPRVSTDILQWTVDSISRITFGARVVNGMATGTGQPEANKAGMSPGVLGSGRDTRLPSRTL